MRHFRLVCSSAILEVFIPVSSIVDEKRRRKKKGRLLGYRVVRSNLCERLLTKFCIIWIAIEKKKKDQDTVRK